METTPVRGEEIRPSSTPQSLGGVSLVLLEIILPEKCNIEARVDLVGVFSFTYSCPLTATRHISTTAPLMSMCVFWKTSQSTKEWDWFQYPPSLLRKRSSWAPHGSATARPPPLLGWGDRIREPLLPDYLYQLRTGRTWLGELAWTSAMHLQAVLYNCLKVSDAAPSALAWTGLLKCAGVYMCALVSAGFWSCPENVKFSHLVSDPSSSLMLHSNEFHRQTAL